MMGLRDYRITGLQDDRIKGLERLGGLGGLDDDGIAGLRDETGNCTIQQFNNSTKNSIFASKN